MLHTINFNLKISSQNYNINFSTLKKYVNALDYNLYPDKNNSKRYQCYKTHCFNDIGISTINLCRYFGKKSGAYIELVVNCPKVIYNGDETRLANVTDYNILEEKFNHIIQHLNNEIFGTKLLPNLNDWLVRRIDYAFDIKTPNVDHYISIFNKGYIPKSFSLKTYYNTSFHIKSDACNYNFYNKTKELSSKHNIHINSNVLRLEVQCKTDKIRKLIKHYDLHSNNISLLWNESIAKEVITEAVTRVIGTYDFYPLNVLHDKIYNSILPKAYKHYAWQLTKLLNNDIYNLSELCQILESSEEYEKEIVKTILHIHKKRLTEKRFTKTKATINGLNYSYAKSYLSKINLSPIAIPQNCQAEYLPNPIKLIQ